MIPINPLNAPLINFMKRDITVFYEGKN